jgi:hypothetical protein
VRPGPDGVLCGFRVKAITRFGWRSQAVSATSSDIFSWGVR